MRHAALIAVILALVAAAGDSARSQARQAPGGFHLIDATISDVHRAIQQGQLTCQGLVQAYVNRARAYNGTCNQLVTEENVSTYLPKVNGYYDPGDIFTTVSRATVSKEPYAKAITEGSREALKGTRIGIIREFMVKQAKVDEPIVDAAAAEMKDMLGTYLGATLVESVTPVGPMTPPSRT